jgi:tetratricopeptide (TPR) repeat protein
MNIRRFPTLPFCLLLILFAREAHGQFKDGNQSTSLRLPETSQAAKVSQTLGLTDISIGYHRPLVNNRKIFGTQIVPYGQVWRAGANENTVIEFTDPVTIEGQPLAKGTYGLHMIPNEDSWTVIFSKNSTSWGSFTYDQKEDALRVTVKPQKSEFHEALTYGIDDVKPDSAVVTLHWENVAVPFKVAVPNQKELVLASVEDQLRTLNHWKWDAYDDAAHYLLDENMHLDEAQTFLARSTLLEERFENLMTKAAVLRAQGNEQDAAKVQALALEKAQPLQLHIYARQLQQQKKQQEAFAIFRKNAAAHPDLWFVHTGLARVYSGEGKYADAVKEMKLAIPGAPEQQRPAMEGLIKRLEASQDINN